MSASQNAVARIVAGVDGSPPSIAALRWAVHQAQLSGSTIDAVIAWEFPIAAGGLGWAPTSGLDDTDYSELAAKALSSAIAEVSPPLGCTTPPARWSSSVHRATALGDE
jgi:hypothetical protein